MYTSSKLVLFVTIIFHCLIFDQTLDAKTLFMSMAMLNNVQFTMTQLMPRLVALGGESLVSLRRIRDFLLSEEFKPSSRLWLEPIRQEDLSQLSSAGGPTKTDKKQLKVFWEMFDTNRLIPQIKLDKQNDAFVQCQNIGACWPKANSKTLEAISFRCEASDLIIICGQTASGKTSLFMSLLNELPISEGTARISGSISYSSQDAWIFSGTVRENIVFGEVHDEIRYRRVIQACALKRDFDLLENGDLTYITVDSLSGGQRARINLARCLYRDCDIYLLDDPFSAIDGPVASHIFSEAIRKFLSNRLVLLATHQVRFLEHCDKILLLDQGRQLAFCGYGELNSMFLAQEGDHFSQRQLERLSFLKEAFGGPGTASNQHYRIMKNDSESICNDNRVTTDESIGVGNSTTPGFELDRKSIKNMRHKDFVTEHVKSSPANILSATCANGQGALPGYKTSASGQSIVSIQHGSVVESLQLGCDNLCPNEIISKQSDKSTEFDSGSRVKSSEQSADSGHHHFSAKSDEALEENNRDNSPIIQGEGVPIGQPESTAGVTANDTTISFGNPYNVDSGSISLGHKKAKLTGIKLGEDKSASLIIAEPNTDDINVASKQCMQSTRGQSDQDKHTYRINSIVDGHSVQKQTSDNEKESPPSSRKTGCINNDKSNQGLADEEEMSLNSKLAGLDVWFKYYTQSSTMRLVLLVFTFLITQTLYSTIDIYLTVWSIAEQNRVLLVEISETNQMIKEHEKNESFIGGVDFGFTSLTGVNDCNITTLVDMLSKSHQVQSTSSRLDQSWLNNFKFQYDCFTKSGQNASESSNIVRILPILMQPFDQFATLHSIAAINKTLHPILQVSFHNGNPNGSVKNSLLYYTKLEVYETPPYDKSRHSLLSAQQQQHLDLTTNDTFQTEGSQMSTLVGSSSLTLSKDTSKPAIPDQELFDESEAALNVRSIYRPLYILVNKLTSQHHATIYALLLGTLFISSVITNTLSYSTSNRSARKLYEKLTDSALFARLGFFDGNPIGRFINRATRDMGIIDEAIPYNANQSYDALLQTAATFIVVSAVDFKLAPLSLIILFVFLIYHNIHVEPTKDIQRMEGIARSPIISHISTTLNGLHTIRVTKSAARFEQTFMKHQDSHSSVFLLKLGCNRCMAVILDWLNASYIGLIAITAIASGMSGPSAGLIITSAMLLSGLTQHGVMKLTETESLMTSVERVIEYCDLPQEECASKRGSRRPNSIITGGCKAIWPSDGCLKFCNVDLYYNRNSTKPVLRNVSFHIEAGERIGIIGRTGAGKSSIIAALFRLYDYDGTILLDGVDTKNLNLIELRTSIGIIPQQPVMFSSSVRENLDPMRIHDDYSLWHALDKAHLRETINALPGRLNYNIGQGGLSTGQKQLICLARVLLRQNKLIVMDEATSNVDPTTDAVIQTTIRREFKHCTVITIAHRLETILDCDRIMVLEAGKIVDFDTPQQLATNGSGCFKDLLRKSGTQ